MRSPTIVRKDSGHRWDTIQAMIGLARFAANSIKQVLIQPLLAALMGALAVGATPLALTALYALVRMLCDLNRAKAQMPINRPVNHGELL